ncbi:hypothetical protein B8X04_17090 [Brevibacterium casei]|uniref:Uncharacterized protein n=1 Tax=Brevibacterium casei TaxID=33889 RepID=A0A269Z4S4_9MICO|nr:hypothetical protein B8X04_17090 [Brevibacterium casei]
MTRLTDEARAVLAGWGAEPITEEEWAQHWGDDSIWRGAECGCPDDRCIGHHHGADEPCGCLKPLIDDYDEAKGRR